MDESERIMKPYYDDGRGIVIYHGDCREVLPTLGPVDLVLTDPPYGIGAAREKPHNGWADYGVADWDLQRPPVWVMHLLLEKAKDCVVWGGNYFTDILPPSMGWMIWDKGQRDFSLADVEMAWTSSQRAARAITYARGKALADGKQHPTQKPLAVIAWALKQYPEAQIVLDPFMGSGTTLVAAKQLGRRAIGIEIEERYCAIAVERLRQEVLDFAPAPASQPEQLSLEES